MTAEGTACKGAGEAGKAEFAPAKGAVGADPVGEMPAEEREREGVGGPFVIVNGASESDVLSDRGSDLDQPLSGGDTASDEDDQPLRNAAPDAAAAAGGDHGAAGGELGTSDVAVDVLSADRAAAESEDGVGEGEEVHVADVVAELVEQESASGEQQGEVEVEAPAASGEQGEVEVEAPAATEEQGEVEMEAPAASGEQGEVEAPAYSGIDHADTSADSAAPAVDSEVNGKDCAREQTAAAVAGLPVHEASTEEKDGAGDDVVSSERDDTLTQAESGSAVLVSEVCGEESKREQGAPEVMDLVTDGSGVAMVNGHHDADTSATTEPVSSADEDKQEQGATNVTEFVEKDAARGKQGVALQANGHDHLGRSADSYTSASDIKAHADESKGKESDQQGAPEIEAEVTEGMLDSSSINGCAYNCEEPKEEEVANGHEYAEDNADASGQLQSGVEEGEGETNPYVLQLEDKMDKESEGHFSDRHISDASFSYNEAKPPMEEGVNEAVPAVADFHVTTGNKSEEIVQGDELVKDDVSAGIPHFVRPESDLFVESSGDQKVQVDVAAGDEITMDSDVKDDSMVEMNTPDRVPLQELSTAVEDRSIPPHANSSNEVEERVFNIPPCSEEVNLAQSVDNSAQTEKHEQLEAPCVGLADKNDNCVIEVEPEKEVDYVPLQAAAASTLHNETRCIDLVDNDSNKHSSVDAELETETEERSSREIANITSNQAMSGDTMEHGTAVADDAELSSETQDGSQEKYSGTAVDQGEPLALNEDEAAVVDDAHSSSATADGSSVAGQVGDISQNEESSNLGPDSNCHKDQLEICSSSTTRDEISSTNGDKVPSPINDLASSTEEPCPSNLTLESEVKAHCTNSEMCLSDEKGIDICFGNVDAHIKSSREVETKCLEALEPSSVDAVVLKEHKNGGEPANADEANIVEDSNGAHVDLDTTNRENTHVIRQRWAYMIKIPKFAGEDLWAKIQDAQIHLDRLTQERDAINIRKQKQKVVCDEYREKLEASRQVEREARAAHGDKKHDLNGVRSMMGRLSKANSIEEIEEMITRKEKIIEHETIPLKEEKLLIKEINELKAQRKQLCSNMGSKAEISEAFHQKDHIHEQHKNLKKDSDVLFNNLKSLEENTRKIQKSYDDERTVFRKLNEEFGAANASRQKAYSDWVELRAEPPKKNKLFFTYKKDITAASVLLSNGDLERFHLCCNDQIERVMGMWNNDDNFRNLYTEANKFSTLRRFGTYDGRKLGPEEVPPVVPRNFVRRQRPSNPSPLTASSPGLPILTSQIAPEKPVQVAVSVEQNSFPGLPSPHICTKAKASGISSQKEITTAQVSEKEEVKHIENHKTLMEEKLELARRAEELAQELALREERAAAEKERLRLEQKAKAKEAEERKKRKAEKAQERAEFKARKEAEMKEKKKLKKDKRNGATPADSASGSGQGNSASMDTSDIDNKTSESIKDADVFQQTAPRKISRPPPTMRQLNRVQPMPLPLRNRGRKKMRQYILIAVAVLSVIAVIVAGSYLHLPSLRSLHF